MWNQIKASVYFVENIQINVEDPQCRHSKINQLNLYSLASYTNIYFTIFDFIINTLKIRTKTQIDCFKTLDTELQSMYMSHVLQTVVFLKFACCTQCRFLGGGRRGGRTIEQFTVVAQLGGGSYSSLSRELRSGRASVRKLVDLEQDKREAGNIIPKYIEPNYFSYFLNIQLTDRGLKTTVQWVRITVIQL